MILPPDLEAISTAYLNAFMEVGEKSTGTNIRFIIPFRLCLEFLFIMCNKKRAIQFFH